MSVDRRLPESLRKMLLLDPVLGREDLDDWIALNQYAAGLYEAALAKYETTDAAMVGLDFAEERRVHRGELAVIRDRHAEAAANARAVRAQLER